MRIAVAGAKGRMGQTVLALLENHPDAQLAGMLDKGDDAAAVLKQAEAIIDFSAPEASICFAETAAALGLIHIIGTTGFTAEQDKRIAAAAQKTVIVKSGNMSLGVNMLAALVKQAAARLGSDYDIEIFEMHHRNKLDAPSGTALMLGEAAAQGRGVPHAKPSTDQSGKRAGEIGFSVARGGEVIGEHEVMFAGPSETLTLSHSALDRSLFARGALKAALWARGKTPGLYSMQDVLELT